LPHLLPLFLLLGFYSAGERTASGMASIYTAGGIVFMGAMASILNRDFPLGLLQYFIELPWPLT